MVIAEQNHHSFKPSFQDLLLQLIAEFSEAFQFRFDSINVALMEATKFRLFLNVAV